MKTSRMYLIFGGAVFFLASFAMLVSAISLFRSVDRSGGVLPGEARLAPAIHAFFDQVKGAESGDDAKRALKSLETAMGLSSSGRQMEQVKKGFAALLEHLSKRPRESEPEYILQKKRDILEYGVNFYRKEAQGGTIAVRSLVLNILFDTQNSLINGSAEAERVSLDKLKDHVTNLKRNISGYHDASISYRINNVDNLVTSLEKGISTAVAWEAAKADLIKKAEKTTDQIVEEIRRDTEGGGESSRREFVYASVFSILVFLLSGVVLIVGYKLIKHRFEDRANLVLSYLKLFGRDKENPDIVRELDRLRADEEWGDLAAGIFSSEDQFVTANQKHMAIWRSITIPYLLFNRDRTVVLSNQSAKNLFGFENESIDFSEIISMDKIGSVTGHASTLVEMIQQSFHAPRDDVYELYVKRGNEQVPVELICNPVVSGPLAGGKIFIFREIRNEADRVNKEVSRQIEYIRDVVHKVTHFYEVEIETPATATPPMKEMLGDLSQMKAKLDDRENLWKSETQGLLDQVERQREILGRMKDEIESIKDRHEALGETIDEMFRGEKIVSDDLVTVGHRLDSWIENRNRLMENLDSHASVMHRVREYEGAIRRSVEDIRNVLAETQQRYQEIEAFRDEVRLASINMAVSTTASEGSAEFAARARSYASGLSDFCARVRVLMERVNDFIKMHPGGSLLPHLESADVDTNILRSLQEEHANLNESLQRWKRSTEEALVSGEKARDIIEEVQKSDVLAHQLSETSLVIAAQAQRNLSRWN